MLMDDIRFTVDKKIYQLYTIQFMKYLKRSFSRSSAILYLLLLAGSFFNASFASGFSYHWAHPSPQGNVVYGLAFTDASHGLAVTGCGSILKTSNGGGTWAMTSGPDSVCNDLYDILVSQQGTVVVSGDHGRIMRSTDNGGTWQTLSFPGAGRLYDLAQVPGGGISAAGENGSLLVSTDDGISWNNKGPGGSGSARHHFWKSTSEGYLVGSGLFHRTLDGGNTWTQVANPGSFGLNEIYFVNSSVGYAVSDFDVWKTTNGGTTWNSVSVTAEPFYRFRTTVIDELHWFTITDVEGGELWETFNAGTSWQKKFSYNSTGFVCLVKNNNRLLFCSDLGDIFFTEDNGSTVQDAVQNLAVFPSAPITVIGKKPDGTLFANNQPNSGVNNGTFFRSDNGGLSWYLPNPSQGLRWVTDIRFFDNEYGVLGSYGDIRYTLDGGATWNTSSLPANFNLTNFAMPASDMFFAGTYGGFPTGGGNLYKSSDHGATWDVVGGGLPSGQLYISNVQFADALVGYIACLVNNVPGIYKTDDGGATWNFISQSGISNYISDMLWLDENNGLAAVPNSGSSGIYRTTDGGHNWTRVSGTSARHFTRGTGEFIAAVNPGDVLFQESADNGLHWTSYSPPFNAGVSGYGGGVESIQATGNGYILGGTGNKLMVAERNTQTGVAFNDNGANPSHTRVNIMVKPNPVKYHATRSKEPHV